MILVGRSARSILLAILPATPVLAGVYDFAWNEAGDVLVRPIQVIDTPGYGSPPLPAGQDGDGFPDTDEAVALIVSLSNKTDHALTNVQVRLESDDPRIACISAHQLSFGTVAARATVDGPLPLRFRVAATADRGGLVPPVACSSAVCSNGAGACSLAQDCMRSALDLYAARFTARVTADQLPPAGETDEFEIELDLDVSSTAAPTFTFVEGFEAGLGSFTLQNLDTNMTSNSASDGKRCSYADPDFANSGTYGETECYLGFSAAPSNDWHSHAISAPDGGRAFAGSRSLHWGRHTTPGMDTYAFAQMDAVVSATPGRLAGFVCGDDPALDKRACASAADCVSVGGGACVPARPELSFKQQAAFYAFREQIHFDGAVVQARTAGTPWRNLIPYWNVHDARAHPVYNGMFCEFDPDDDGHDEDDRFRPQPSTSQPGYEGIGAYDQLGPSSTCYPQFVFGSLGDTGQPYAPGNIGDASDGPGLAGSLGPGTWIETRYDLSGYRGRSIQLRFLVSTVRYPYGQTYDDYYHFNPAPWDDGWYVDDVRLSQSVSTGSTTVTLDSADRSALPGCPFACSIVPVLESVPSPCPAPGNTVVLNAGNSVVNGCPPDSVLYAFWRDGNADGELGAPPDWILDASSASTLAWTLNDGPVSFGANIRCGTIPTCTASAAVTVPLECPQPGVFNPFAWYAKLRAHTSNEPYAGWQYLSFGPYPPPDEADWARGTLSSLRGLGGFGQAVCEYDDGGGALDIEEDPPVGDGFYYVARGTENYCSETPSYSTFHPAENPGDPQKRDREIVACPPP